MKLQVYKDLSPESCSFCEAWPGKVEAGAGPLTSISLKTTG